MLRKFLCTFTILASAYFANEIFPAPVKEFFSHQSLWAQTAKKKEEQKNKNNQVTETKKTNKKSNQPNSGPSIPVAEKSGNLIAVIDEEIKTLKLRFPKAIQTDPNMMFRMSELYFEKAKIVKTEENIFYLKTPEAERKKQAPDYFFKNSRTLFRMAQDIGLKVLPLTNKRELKSEIYLILAYNSQEFANEQQAVKYFYLALEYSTSGSKVNHKAKVALADFYYNQRQYEKALNLYKDALTFNQYNWWTKDAINMAWCYFELKFFNEATETLKTIYLKSKTPEYIDVSDRALKTITLFFSSAKMNGKALEFFKKIGINVSAQFIEMSKVHLSKRDLNASEETLDIAEKQSLDLVQRQNVFIARLELFESFGQLGKHYAAAQSLFELHKQKALEGERLETYQIQMVTMASRLQNQISKDSYDNAKNDKVKKGRIATSYFRMLSFVIKLEEIKYNYLEAETWFAIDDFNESLKMYYTVMSKCFARKFVGCEKKIVDNAINGSLASLGQERLSKEVREKYLIATYEKILAIEPVSERSQKIYVRLFNSYLEKAKQIEAENVIKRYQTYYPQDHPVLEGMVARILEDYRKQSNITQLLSWAERINKKEFIVSDLFEKNLHAGLAQLRLVKIQNSINVGNKKAALTGYLELFQYALTPVDAKKNAAYNLGLLYFELGWIKETLQWLMTAFSMQTDSEVLKFADTYSAVAMDLFYRRDLNTSSQFSLKLIERLCASDYKNFENLFKNTATLLFVEKQYSKLDKLMQDSQKCSGLKKETSTSLQLSFLNDYVLYKELDRIHFAINQLSPQTLIHHQLVMPSYSLYYEYHQNNNKTKSGAAWSSMLQFVESAKKQNLKLPAEYAKVEADQSIKEFNQKLDYYHSIVLEFPEEVFNTRIQEKIEKLELVTDLSLKILKIGSGTHNIIIYKELIIAYDRLAKFLQEFTPPNKEAEYVKGFKESMLTLVGPLRDKANEFKAYALKLINDKRILSKENFWILSHTNLPVTINYYYADQGITMDRSGK